MKNGLDLPPDTSLLLKIKGSCGLRASELFAIRPRDIDFETGRVRVVRQLQNGLELDLKTETSRRTVTVPSAVLKELREHPRRALSEEPLQPMTVMLSPLKWRPSR